MMMNIKAIAAAAAATVIFAVMAVLSQGSEPLYGISVLLTLFALAAGMIGFAHVRFFWQSAKKAGSKRDNVIDLNRSEAPFNEAA